MKSYGLKIEVVENGFILSDRDISMPASSRDWVFNDALSLSEFILKWGELAMAVDDEAPTNRQ